jgi:hypothetical protein
MSRRRLLGAIVASVVVIAAVVVIIALSVIPLPEFATLPAGELDESMSFVDEESCVQIADLSTGSVTELSCEPDQGAIDHLAWIDSGIEITTYFNQRITKVLDPETGEILETRTGDKATDPSEAERPADELFVNRPDEGVIVIYDEDDNELLRLKAPERYWIETATQSADGRLVGFTDSTGRLAVFEPGGASPYLVADEVRPWPPPVWAP